MKIPPYFPEEERDEHCYWVDLPEKRSDMLDAYGLWLFGFQRKVDWQPCKRVIPRYFKFYGISHLIKGKGWYWSHDTNKVEYFEAGTVVISTPEYIQAYGGAEKVYSEDHICFYGPLADKLFEAGIIENGIVNLGSARKLLPIIEQLQRPAFQDQLKASLMLQDLLLEVHQKKSRISAGSRYSSVSELIKQIEQEPQRWWSLDEMAEFCNLSISQFRRVFEKQTGMGPKLYIDKSKMARAAEKLCITQDTVSDVAECFGYDDPYHFSRRFKQIMGDSPLNYREKNSRRH